MKKLLAFVAIATFVLPICVAQPLLRSQTYAVFDSSGVFKLTDSTWYYYSGSRGSSIAPLVSGGWIDYINLKEDIAFDSAFSQSTPFGVPDSRVIYTYNSSDKVLTELTSSLVPVASAYAYENVQMLAHEYNADGDRIYTSASEWYTTPGTWGEFGRSYYTYTASHAIDTTINDINGLGTPGMWMHAKRLITSFDGAGNRAAVLIQNPDAAAADWVDFGWNTFTYDATGNMLTRMVRQWQPDSAGVYHWLNVQKWVNTFNGANKVTSLTYYWYGGADTGEVQRIDTFTYDAAGNLASVISRIPGPGATFVNSRSYYYNYNTDNQLTRMYTNTWNTATNTWGLSPNVTDPDHIRTFHYSNTPNDPFDPNYGHTIVNTAFINNSAIGIYPSPASNLLYVDVLLSNPLPISLALYDMTGKLCMIHNEKGSSHSTNVLNVAGVSDGTYVLKVGTAESVKAFQVTIMH